MNLGLTWHDVVHIYECHFLASVGFYLKSRFDTVRMVSCLEGWLPDRLQGLARRFSLPNSGRRAKWGSLGLGPSTRDLALLVFLPFSFNTSPSPSDNFHWSNHDFLSDIFADKRHVALKLNLVNVPGLNKLLRLEVFISEDRQLRAVHLILDY